MNDRPVMCCSGVVITLSGETNILYISAYVMSLLYKCWHTPRVHTYRHANVLGVSTSIRPTVHPQTHHSIHWSVHPIYPSIDPIYPSIDPATIHLKASKQDQRQTHPLHPTLDPLLQALDRFTVGTTCKITLLNGGLTQYMLQEPKTRPVYTTGLISPHVTD